MTLGVCVVAAGRRTHLAGLLHGLDAQERPADRVVVVVLDDEPVDADRRRADVVRWPCDPAEPLPVGAARNLGAAHLRTEHLVMLDVDCIPAPDFVARYAAVLDRHPTAIACGPVRYLAHGWDVDGDPRSMSSLDACSTAPAARPTPRRTEVLVDGDHHDLFWSLSFGVTATTWKAVGGFDESFVGYGAEDTDLAWRARELGVPLAWFGGGVVYHQWHVPARDDRRRIPELVANARRFHARWGRWPMDGWLTELHRRGWVRFDPRHDLLVVT